MKKCLVRFLICLAMVFGLFAIILQSEAITANASTSTSWAWPTSVHTIKSDWPNYSSGSYHAGTDFPVALNSPVYSTCDGEVVAVTSLTYSYGKHIKIKAVVNGAVVYIRYCHLNSFAVSKGDKVSAGQLIAYSGSTGNSTGPHLHYEVRNANDRYGSSSSPNLNPRNYLPGTSYSYETNSASNSVPTGCVDVAEGSGRGKIHVRGWAFDSDSTSANIEVHVYIGGTADDPNAEGHVIVANKERTDVNTVYGCGNNHGFDDYIVTSKSGTQQVYFYAIDTAGGTNYYMGSKTVNITKNNKPTGCSDDISGGCGSIHVGGWTYDPDSTATSIQVHVYIGGSAGQSGAEYHAITANVKRTDVNKAAGCGDYHGYDAYISTSKTGNQPVYVYAIDTDGGENLLIKNTTVNITANSKPVGSFDGIECENGKLHVTGWAYDPDSTSRSVTLHVYVGGSCGDANAKCYAITANTKRTDVNAAYKCGDYHGFDSYITIPNTGSQKVYIYAIDNDYSGNNPEIGNKTVTMTHSYTATVTKQPTCTEAGVKTYQCPCGESYTEAIAATGHKYGSATYKWTNCDKCVATRVCENDKSHVETATATISSKQTKASTYTEKGELTYTATFDAAWAKTQTNTEELALLSAPMPSAEPTATPTAVLTPSAEATATPTAMPTPSAEATATPTAVPMPSAEPIATPTATPTAVPVPSAEPTATPTAVSTPSAEPTATPNTAPSENPVLVFCGDMDENGEVDAKDALTVLQAVVRLTTLSDTQVTVADVDGDNTVAAGDALFILQKVVRLIDAFPVEEQ